MPGPLWLEPEIGPEQIFRAAQPLSKYYNQYAGYLARIYDAYAFPYSDKSGTPLVDLTPGVITGWKSPFFPIRPCSGARSMLLPKRRENQSRTTGPLFPYLRVSGQSGKDAVSKVAYSDINLNLDIDHASVGDLAVKLTAPSGEVFVIQDGADEGEDLHITELPLPSEKSGNPNGVWTLTTTDSKRENSGTPGRLVADVSSELQRLSGTEYPSPMRRSSGPFR